MRDDEIPESIEMQSWMKRGVQRSGPPPDAGQVRPARVARPPRSHGRTRLLAFVLASIFPGGVVAGGGDRSPQSVSGSWRRSRCGHARRVLQWHRHRESRPNGGGGVTSVEPRVVYRPVEYPDFDGKAIAESDVHQDERFDLLYRLRVRYAARRDVYVTGNVYVYYTEGDPSATFAPDVMVVFGVPPARRRVYKLWEEKHPQVAQALWKLAEAHAQQDPSFRTTLSFTRLTAAEALKQLSAQGFADELLPSPSTMAEVLNRNGYRLRPVLKAKPQKSSPRPMRSSPTSATRTKPTPTPRSGA